MIVEVMWSTFINVKVLQGFKFWFLAVLIKKQFIALVIFLSPFRGCLDKISFQVKFYFQFSVWSVTYNCLHEITQNEIRCRCYSLHLFWLKWNFISGDKIFCKHYPEMKSFEKKYLCWRIFNWNKYSRSKDQNKNEFNFISPVMKTNVNRALFMAIWEIWFWVWFKHLLTVNLHELHCVKSVHIRSYSGQHSPTFELKTDQNNSKYGHFLRIVRYTLVDIMLCSLQKVSKSYLEYIWH